MEIGTEISRKIRSAIKGKLQELGAYVDEELPDYIMVMVANKKSQDQMTEDLSLFLGNNTIRFTVWLHGVLDKLRSVTTDPSSLKSSDTNIFDSNVPSNKSSFSRGDERRHEAAVPPLAVSSTRPEKRESRVSTSSQEQKATNVRQTYDDGAATRLMSTVKPLREPAPSEDVIDIKPEPDDLIDEDLNFVQENPLSQKKPTVTLTYGSSRPSIEIYRPPASRNADSGAHLNRLQFQQQQNSIHAAKQLDIQTSRIYETGRLCEPEVLNSLEETYSPFFRNSSEKMSIEEENFRKRKLPVVSSVVKVKKFNHDGEEEEEDDDCGSRTGSISSSVSVPAKPERRPSLPPSKQANKNLILKAISEAQESVTKTTNYSAVSQKQTLPVAPRTRTSQEELLAEMVQGQSRAPRMSSPIKEEETKGDNIDKSQGTQQRQLLSRLQIDPVMAETLQISQDYYDMESMVHADTRSFILKKPKLSEEIVVAPNQESGMKTADTLRVLSGHLMQTRDLVQPDKPASPKFIVTLDGVPSPPGYMSDQEEDMSFEGMRPAHHTAASHEGLAGLLHPQQLHLLSRQLEDPDGSFTNAEMSELSVAQKPEKLLERCKYWPACKNGDECAYHHPVSPCKAFPNCKFAEKCLFVHPNCKYDAKCTKPECPFTHMSRRIPVLPPKPVTTPAPPSSSQLCRYFPACKKMECPFYHPKHCRFNTQCTRPDCTFYHPTITVPPRHALKWIRPQTSE
ncbi:zinc finger CCCH domain-containing protein 14 isoform X2 [Lagenorhynchus albirostris]|uniref:Zinc finger CCCH domain-containing protein 14 n=1 Tax=Tursiops truncatus TaxID=9739 RepID=A0A2U4A2E2_TURTR|nr:zinc finger CCCH domain-containing protein 14 isoform X2 [Tursiops truncatus]XP_026976061.1 zinc finger CCCH domain-containing protein 14 isoform X2 [Lagenorhynchus obliquidens]XP_030739490.1 zinc finger CCCH domain-containing protein 14 isoform X2 [Globicephala melas]XP_059860061.1 zinc finger CCCH domain-containing protein 14 isoform X2 [Delphinus delphis]XP_059979074.1 zinc finger CCCH domain-containing protein 14 isoform X2 [Lagenorhynchus albirostris]